MWCDGQQLQCEICRRVQLVSVSGFCFARTLKSTFTQANGWKEQQFHNSTLRDLRILFSQNDPKTWKRNWGKLLLQYRITVNINHLFIFVDYLTFLSRMRRRKDFSANYCHSCLVENILQTSFVIVSEMFNYVRFYTFWYCCSRLFKILNHRFEKRNLIYFLTTYIYI